MTVPAIGGKRIARRPRKMSLLHMIVMVIEFNGRLPRVALRGTVLFLLRKSG